MELSKKTPKKKNKKSYFVKKKFRNRKIKTFGQHNHMVFEVGNKYLLTIKNLSLFYQYHSLIVYTF